MTRNRWISALALALALGGGAAWGQEPNAIDDFQGSSNTPMSPNCTRVPYFNELPRFLFSRDMPGNACNETSNRDDRIYRGGPRIWHETPVSPVLSLDCESASDQATQRMLGKLLALWKT